MSAAEQFKSELYISPEECAKRTGYAERYFKERVAKQKGFPKKIGKSYYWPDVHRFLNS